MSLSCREVACRRGRSGPLEWLALALLIAPPAGAQQLVITPRVATTVEWDSNPVLLVDHPQSGEWYQALFAADLQEQSVRSDLELAPMVTVQHSSISALDRYEALVNLKSKYLTEKSVYSIIAEFHRQDTYNAEYGVAEFNPLNPNAPNTAGTGYIVTGVTRDSYQVSPSFEHSFTQRFSGEADATFLAVRYSVQVPEELASFNAPSASLNGVWAVSQRGQLAVGPFYSEYDPLDPEQEGVLKSRSYGASIAYRYETSQLTSSAVTARIGRDEQDQFAGPRLGTTTWGLDWRGTYKLQTGSLVFVVGRLLEPSSAGGEIALYQVRAQYFQQFSQTLTGQVAVRLVREQGVGAEEDVFGSRNRGFGDLSMTKLFSREFYVQGGYRFLAQKLAPDVPLAQSHGVYLTIGWHPIVPR